jgi:DNA-binding PadR family transcriptional regulator
MKASHREERGRSHASPKAHLLGRFEYSLLRAIEILGTEAYGAQIGRFLSEKLGRDVTAPQVYITLERMAKRRLVRSENTDPVSARGGRSRKRFIIEADGARALRETAAVLNAIPTSHEVQNAKQAKCPA